MGEDPKDVIMVLEERITHADFVRVATSQGWQLRQVEKSDVERAAYQETWATPDGRGVITFIDDPTLMCRQIWVRGDRLDELHFELSGRLPAWELEELSNMSRRQPGTTKR